MVDRVFPIEGVIRRYDWGSHTAIQEILGQAVDGRPAAELWFGAHAGDPSPAAGSTLDRLVTDDPVGLLGEDTVAAFGARLPFLLKVLAAETALSIQVHPTLEQARAGFAAEQSSDAPVRNYTDPNHKPELFCALRPAEVLCGFRPVGETLAVVDDIPELALVADELRRPDGLRRAFTALLTHDDPAPLAAAVAARATEDGPLRPAWLAAQHFPGDIGVVVTLLLNYVRLDAGQAVYLGAGNVHAYLRGVGVEIMANSDNVLRCGLTSKHIDVPELLKITDFSELREPRWAECDSTFRVPVPDFALRIVHGQARLEPGTPRIVLCTSGSVTVDGIRLAPGHAAFVCAGHAAIVHADGVAFVATTG
jgi:mannose-6-phosphate isomerase